MTTNVLDSPTISTALGKKKSYKFLEFEDFRWEFKIDTWHKKHHTNINAYLTAYF